MLAVTKRSVRKAPAYKPALCVLTILAIAIAYPTTNCWTAGFAQTALNLAIIAPLFWVPVLRIDLNTLKRVFFILWAFHTVSAIFGILQVYFPGHFQPPLSTVIGGFEKGVIRSMMIETNSGERVFRPMGLTDSPGGAATAGFYAVLLGMAFFLLERRAAFRIACLGSMVVGLAVVALSQVRSILIVILVGIAAFIVILTLRNLSVSGRLNRYRMRVRKPNLASLVTAIVLVFFLASTLALSLARKSVLDRLTTLVTPTQSTQEIYYSNRGHFLSDTIYVYLPRYPFGAGLGRYGMISYYFGVEEPDVDPPLWAEIQWTAWLFDGGVPLIVAYVAAIWVSMRFAYKTALSRDSHELSIWGALIFSYNLGTIAATFDYIPFLSQQGLEFWFLNALLFGAVQQFKHAGGLSHIKPTPSFAQLRVSPIAPLALPPSPI